MPIFVEANGVAETNGRMRIPSGKHTKNYGKIHHAIHGKTHELSMAIVNSYVGLPEDINHSGQKFIEHSPAIIQSTGSSGPGYLVETASTQHAGVATSAIYIYSNAGWWFTYPSEKYESIGMMTFPTDWRNKKCSKPPTRMCQKSKACCGPIKIIKVSHRLVSKFQCFSL